jgi:hypothetical protein
LRLDNQEHGWPNQPERVPLTPERQEQLQRVIRELPEKAKLFANEKLAGIFIVRDLGGTGYTESILDENRNPVAGFIVLDELVFGKKANEWATWKERSPFTHAGDLKMTIEYAAHDTVANAIQYILLHEMGHVSAIGTDLQPRQDTTGGEDADPAKFAFSKLSWQRGPEDFTTLPADEFEERTKLQFYRGGLDADVPAVYRKLQNTSFPTLYASTNVNDDWAESFASYVHVVLLKKPYLVEAGDVLFGPCWGNRRCAAKEKVLRGILGP